MLEGMDEKRVSELLAGAVEKGLVDRHQVASLSTYLAKQMAAVTEQGSVEEVERETPKVIRGFHDVLIAIGVAIALIGLGLLTQPYYTIPLIVVFSEVLVRRQRLPLTGLLLTLSLGFASMMAVVQYAWRYDDYLQLLLAGGAGGILLGVYYWRYRVPLSFAGMMVHFVAGGVGGLLYLVGWWTREPYYLENHPILQVAIGSSAFVVLFGVALYFDLSPARRIGLQGDRAFWLHLSAAPTLMVTAMIAIYSGLDAIWLNHDTTVRQAFALLGAVLGIALIGLILNRRAFVTSGLVSLGYALKVFFVKAGASSFVHSTETLIAIVLLMIGFAVLILALGWNFLRWQLLKRLPPYLVRRLPEVV